MKILQIHRHHNPDLLRFSALVHSCGAGTHLYTQIGLPSCGGPVACRVFKHRHATWSAKSMSVMGCGTEMTQTKHVAEEKTPKMGLRRI